MTAAATLRRAIWRLLQLQASACHSVWHCRGFCYRASLGGGGGYADCVLAFLAAADILALRGASKALYLFCGHHRFESALVKSHAFLFNVMFPLAERATIVVESESWCAAADAGLLTHVRDVHVPLDYRCGRSRAEYRERENLDRTGEPYVSPDGSLGRIYRSLPLLRHQLDVALYTALARLPRVRALRCHFPNPDAAECLDALACSQSLRCLEIEWPKPRTMDANPAPCHPQFAAALQRLLTANTLERFSLEYRHALSDALQHSLPRCQRLQSLRLRMPHFLQGDTCVAIASLSSHALLDVSSSDVHAAVVL
jgi:hypothetical protein